LFGDQLSQGQDFAEQKPVICISFTNGAITDKDGRLITKIHSLFHIMERDGCFVLSENMELHYINMSAFVKALAEANGGENAKGGENAGGEAMDAMFIKWLALITQKDIKDKDVIKKFAGEEADIMEAVADLARLNEDKIRRYNYERRLDEMRSYNQMIRDIEKYRAQAAQAEKYRVQADEYRAQAAKVDEYRAQADEYRAQAAKAGEYRAQADEYHSQADEYRAQAERERREKDEAWGELARLKKLMEQNNT
jgi:hypothetical protein